MVLKKYLKGVSKLLRISSTEAISKEVLKGISEEMFKDISKGVTSGSP